MLAESLAELGFRTDVALDALQLVGLFHSSPERTARLGRHQLIVSDVRIWQTAALALPRDPDDSLPRLVLLSASDPETRKLEAECGSGASAVVREPFDIDDFVAAVLRLLPGQGANAGTFALARHRSRERSDEDD